MDARDLDHSFELLSRQIARIQAKAQVILAQAAEKQSAADLLLVSALDELSTAVEELRVTRETMLIQHDQLEDLQNLLDSERLRYQALFQDAPDPYLVTTTAGVIIEANSASEKMFNVQLRHLVGKPLRVYFAADDRQMFTAQLRQLLQDKEQKTIQWEARLLPRKHAPLYVSVMMTLVRDRQQQPTEVRWQLRDVTRYKQIEAEIRHLNATLEERVRERTELIKSEHEMKEDALKRERMARIEAEVLRDISRVLSSSLDLPQVLDHILTNVGLVVPHDAADVMLVDEKDVVLALCRGYDQTHNIFNLRFPLQETFPLAEMFQTGQPLIISTLPHIPRWIAALQATSEVQSYIGIPIRGQGQIIGFLNLTSTVPNFFTAQDIEMLEAFSAHAAAAIQNARLYEQTRSLVILEERQRLARDLHDAVSQSLFTSTLVAEALPKLLDGDRDELLSHLDYLYRLNRGALAEMRTLLLELHPTHLKDTGISVLLQQLIDALKGRKEMRLILDLQLIEEALPLQVKVAFYRIAQEALNNVVKHSDATQVQVALTSDARCVRMKIEDNGSGFDQRQPSAGMGLSSMVERAETVQAALTITSEKSLGTRVEVLWERS